MKKHLKLWQSESQHEDYVDSTAFTYHYVCLVKDDYNVHYDPKEPSTSYTFSNMEYDAVVPASATSNDISWDYSMTARTRSGRETVTTGSDDYIATFSENVTDSAKTINGEIVRYDATAEYEFTQKGIQLLTAKYNVTNTSYPTQVLSDTAGIDSVYVDGVKQQYVRTGYTFSTTGEHTVKYYLNETTIGNSSFKRCYNMVDIIIPDSITNIGVSAFTYCSGLTSVTIGSGLTSIDKYAFGWCYGLTNIDIPDSVTSIGADAFISCSGLTNCTIGSGVTSIGYGMFYNCSGLTSVGPVGSGASVEIPSGVTSIGDSAFGNCDSLTSVTIPNSVTSIGDNAFGSCCILPSCTIGSGVTSIGRSAFQYCNSLTSMVIPDNVTSIGNSVFIRCRSLASCTIGNGVTSIGINTFYQCSGLTSCTIGSGVTSIGEYAFCECSGLTSITINATTPPTLANTNAFSYTNNCPIYVPSESVDAYKVADGWEYYASRIQAIP